LVCNSRVCRQPNPTGGGGSGAGGSLGTGGAGPGNDAGTVDAGGSFDVAPHPSLPEVVDFGGPVLATPKVLPIVFGGDSQVADVKAFLDEVAASAYWRQTTSEYGVGTLTVLPVVTLPTPQTSITDAALQSEIAVNTAGSPAPWGPPDPSVIYLFALPQGTIATDRNFACCTDFGGYHDETASGTAMVPYAVACVCPNAFPGWSALDIRTATMSHELIEAATDPFPRSAPALHVADDADVAWTLITEGEVGDMCAVAPDAFILPAGAKYVVQRTWSNAAASLGQQPCVPAPKAPPYFNSVPVLDLVPFGGRQTRGVQIPVGQSRTVALDLFSVGPTPKSWILTLYNYEDFFGGTPSLGFSLDKTSGHNGDVLQLTITALQANAQVGASPFVVVSTYSAPSSADYQVNVSMGLVTN
jgi:hypothetical protein